MSDMSPIRVAIAVMLPLLLAAKGYRKRSLSASGAIVGMCLGAHMCLTNYCFVAALFAFFVSGSALTKFKSQRKRRIDADFKEGGQRDWTQVLCNGGAAWVATALYLLELHGPAELPIDFVRYPWPSSFSCAVLGALAACAGDTWASEIGSVLGLSQTRLITTWRRVPAGTNGGVTLLGSLASMAGGAFVGLAYYVCLVACTSSTLLAGAPAQWRLIGIGAAAGTFGSMLDSLLGATLQFSGQQRATGAIVNRPGPSVNRISGCHVLSNSAVNLITSAVSAVASSLLSFYVMRKT